MGVDTRKIEFQNKLSLSGI